MTPRLAGQGDLAAMLAIFNRAFADDQHTQLQIAWRGHDALSQGMADALAFWLASPASRLLVVEDTQTRAILGWACWASFGSAQASASETADGAAIVLSPIDALERLTRGDIQQCQDDVLARCGEVDVLVSIAVDPAHQSRGVGSALIGWGTRRADTLGRTCWVHASEAGARSVARHGFRLHRENVIDLSPYAPPGDTRSWGTVRFLSMTRPPASDGTAIRSE